MRIKSIKVVNYKGLKNVGMYDIPGFAVLVGANGAGKTTFIGIFDFLKDCLKENVRYALGRRGGFQQVVSRGHEGETIQIELKVQLDFEDEQKSRTVMYFLEIGEVGRKVSVVREVLSFRRLGNRGAPFHFIDFQNGFGKALSETEDSFDSKVDYSELGREDYELDSPDILAIKALGQFKEFDAASQLRNLIENWNVSDFHISEARNVPELGQAEHLSPSGDNLPLYTQYLSDYYPELFQELTQKMAERVPGIADVTADTMEDGRVALKFKDNAFATSFSSRFVSDGTIKMFAYLALLHDPDPHPLLCVEEPENQLYPTLLGELAEEFEDYAARRKGDGQVFVTTHSPDFLDHVPLESIYWLEKKNGVSTLHRAKDYKLLKKLIDEGDTPGLLWRQGFFEGADPE